MLFKKRVTDDCKQMTNLEKVQAYIHNPVVCSRETFESLVKGKWIAILTSHLRKENNLEDGLKQTYSVKFYDYKGYVEK